MADSRRPHGERVFCHQCSNEWDRAHGGLTCPRCDGDFTEILEPGTTSSIENLQEPSPTPSPELPSPLLGPLRNHNPWADEPFSSNDGNNSTTFEFTSNNGGGRIVFSTRTFRSDGMGFNVMDTHDEEVADGFEDLLTDLADIQNRPLGNPFGPLHPFAYNRPPPPPPPGFGGVAGGFFPRDPRDPHTAMQPANLQDLFSLILQTMPPAMTNHNNNNRDPNERYEPFLPIDLLQQLFNPGNAAHGDMVYSQEAFDRIMTQLMEQHNESGAPPPASEAAIKSLAKKKVDKEMLGSEGQAECSICMDNVELGTDVTVLPCNHWFHGDCVTAWLKEHDTCPHCRKSISTAEDSQQPASPRRRGSRQPSSTANPLGYGPPDGSQYNPIPIPESPIDRRESNRSYYGRRPDFDGERPDVSRNPSSQNDMRRYSSRGHSRNSTGSRSSANNGGGVTGWIRDHLPFS